ncbi:MAG: type II secretion system F family protein [Planctomycetota bacterium]
MPDQPLRVRCFRYVAVGADGRQRQGEHSGDSAWAVRAVLQEQGYTVLRMREQRLTTSRLPLLAPMQRLWHRHLLGRRRARRADLLDAVATMLDAGLPLDRACDNLADAAGRQGAERRMLSFVRDRVREGMALHEAVAYLPDWFSPVDQAMLRAGQQAGELPAILRSLAEAHQSGSRLGQQLLTALAYPGLLLLAAIGVAIFLSTTTLPALVQVLEQGEQAVPWLTLILMQVGQALAVWWPALLLLPVLVLVALPWLLARLNPRGRLARLLASNVIARTLRRSRLAQLADTLARLQSSGVPLDEALGVVAATAPGASFTALLKDAAEAIRAGRDFSSVLAASPLVEAEFGQLLAIGEQSGELPSMLRRIGARYARAAERSVATLTAVLEPLAIISMAALIGLMVWGAMLPLIRLGDLV